MSKLFKFIVDKVKADKVPIFVMVGSASCGKSKIGTYVANVIGT